MLGISKKHVGIVLAIVMSIVFVASVVTTKTLRSQLAGGIISPQNGETVKGVVTVQWLAKAPSGHYMHSVFLYVDGIADGRTKPHSRVLWTDPGYGLVNHWTGTFSVDTRNLSNGPHTLKLHGTYAWQNNLGPWPIDYSPITIHVQNGGVSDTQPPSVSIVSPRPDQSVSGLVPISFTATDDKGIAKLELWADGKLIRTIAKNNRDIQWDSKNKTAGPHTLEIRAYDRSGQVGTASVRVNVAKNASPAAPQVKFTNVQQGNIFRGTKSICALATDDKGVMKLEWWMDGRYISTVYNNSGQAMQTKVELCRDWNSANVPDGTHTVEVRAYDADWNVGQHQVRVQTSNKIQK